VDTAEVGVILAWAGEAVMAEAGDMAAGAVAGEVTEADGIEVEVKTDGIMIT
jgi:hypothetical protein